MVGHKHTFAILIFMAMQQQKLFAYPTPVDFSGKISRWPISKSDQASIEYFIEAPNVSVLATYESYIDAAAQLWTDVPTSYFVYERVFNKEDAKVTFNIESEYSGNQYSSGYSIFDETNADGPSHCSVYVAVREADFITDIRKTSLHELGHCLGLGHSLIPEAIMSYHGKKNKFALDTDDQAAISRLYPEDGSSPKLPPGCAIPSTTGTPFRLLYFLLPLLITVRLPERSEGRRGWSRTN